MSVKGCYELCFVVPFDVCVSKYIFACVRACVWVHIYLYGIHVQLHPARDSCDKLITLKYANAGLTVLSMLIL